LTTSPQGIPDLPPQFSIKSTGAPNGLISPAWRGFLLLSTLIIALAFCLRIYHLSQRSLWLDEAIAANISRGTLAQTLTLTRGLHSAPILDPMVLYAVEKVGDGPLAVRLPSLVASLLAVMLMLCFAAIPSVGTRAAALSALMLSVSAAQIRYAQEVREYSFSVLYAGVLLYAFLAYLSGGKRRGAPIPFLLVLFVAPFIQYGLVLFSGSILAALLIVDFTGAERGRRFGHILIASAFLALGCLLSYLLTLRYQWEGSAWYLKDYYWSPGSNLLRFFGTNTHYLFTSFLLPGLGAALISVAAMLLYLTLAVRRRSLSPLAVLAFTSFGTVLAFSLLHLYPYGPVRQCLFLAPVMCLFAATCLVEISERFAGRANVLVFAAMAGLVVLSGALQIRSLKPYAEVEDMQQVLQFLHGHMEPGDNVFVYPGAVPAVDFYLKQRDPRFLYSDYHQQEPEKYAVEMQAGLAPGTRRAWILFCHIFRQEDQRILGDLGADWNVAPALSVKGCALYLASSRAPVAELGTASAGSGVTSKTGAKSLADATHETFWEWNLHNARPSIR